MPCRKVSVDESTPTLPQDHHNALHLNSLIAVCPQEPMALARYPDFSLMKFKENLVEKSQATTCDGLNSG